MAKAYKSINLTEQPEITIGDINDITGTIADKDRFILDASGNRINPATDEMLEAVVDSVDTIAGNQIKYRVQLASGVTLRAGSSVTYDQTIPDAHTGGVIIVRLTYDASATAGATINTYYSPDGTNFDTEPVDTLTPAFAAGATKQQSFIIACPCKSIRIQVVNNDSSCDLTIDSLWLITMP